MYRKKKLHSWHKVTLLVLICLLLDFLMLGLCAARPLQWTRMGYVVALVTGASWWLIGFAGWNSIIVGTLLNGFVISEVALTVLVGAIGLFIGQRIITLPFAQSMLASFLIGCFLLGALFLRGAEGCLILNTWTFLQIIANIIITNLLLKSIS